MQCRDMNPFHYVQFCSTLRPRRERMTLQTKQKLLDKKKDIRFLHLPKVFVPTLSLIIISLPSSRRQVTMGVGYPVAL